MLWILNRIKYFVLPTLTALEVVVVLALVEAATPLVEAATPLVTLHIICNNQDMYLTASYKMKPE